MMKLFRNWYSLEGWLWHTNVHRAESRGLFDGDRLADAASCLCVLWSCAVHSPACDPCADHGCHPSPTHTAWAALGCLNLRLPDAATLRQERLSLLPADVDLRLVLGPHSHAACGPGPSAHLHGSRVRPQSVPPGAQYDRKRLRALGLLLWQLPCLEAGIAIIDSGPSHIPY